MATSFVRSKWLSAISDWDEFFDHTPLLTPPLPAESWAFSGAHQMPPNLPLHPEFNVGKAARVPYRKVVDPTPQNRIDQVDHPPDGLADIAPEDFLELLQESRPLLQLRHVLSPPLSLTAANAAILKT
jgi:hypothetical protein